MSRKSGDEYELVDHPDHYNYLDIECIDIIENFNFSLGSTIKYIWRAGLKPGIKDIEDLRKAIWYLKREIERMAREGNKI